MRRLGVIGDAAKNRPASAFRQQEYFDTWGTYGRFPKDLLDQRRLDKIATRGRALVGPLVEAVVARGGALAVGTAVERLIVDDARVIGVRTAAGDVMARYGVVLACGGFEWNAEMCDRFLSGPVRARCSPPTMVGDGIRMAMAAGSDVSAMNEAWWGVMAHIPGLEADGEPLQTMTTIERSLPGTILVNQTGAASRTRRRATAHSAKRSQRSTRTGTTTPTCPHTSSPTPAMSTGTGSSALPLSTTRPNGSPWPTRSPRSP